MAAAIGLEAGHVQRALVEVFVTHRQRVGAVGIGRVPFGGRDKLVHVLAARVVTHVGHHRLARHRFGKTHTLVRKTTQAGALAHGEPNVVGVHLHHITKGVHFVAVVAFGITCQRAIVPAHILVGHTGAFPAVAAGSTGLAAVALQACHLFVFLATPLIVLGIAKEIAGPVFLARHKRAPGGLAGAAVVQRAARAGRVRAEFGGQVLAALCRAVDQHLGQRCDAAVKGRRGLIRPLAALGLDLHHREAVNGHFFVHFCRWAWQG